MLSALERDLACATMLAVHPRVDALEVIDLFRGLAQLLEDRTAPRRPERRCAGRNSSASKRRISRTGVFADEVEDVRAGPAEADDRDALGA